MSTVDKPLEAGPKHGTGAAPYVITVAFSLKAAGRERFMELVTANARASIEREPGCLRFDVLVPLADAGPGPLAEPRPEVLLYEIYADKAAFAAHLGSDHFRAFDEATRSVVLRKVVEEYGLVPEQAGLPEKRTKETKS